MLGNFQSDKMTELDVAPRKVPPALPHPGPAPPQPGPEQSVPSQSRVKKPKLTYKRLIDTVYQINCDLPGSRKLLIINNLNSEIGRMDVDNVVARFENLGFQHDIHTRIEETDKMIKLLTKTSEIMKDVDCFICVILAKGGEGYVEEFSTEGKHITIEELCDPFKGNNCAELLLKPKMFIIMSWGREPNSSRAVDGDFGNADELPTRRIPTESDILVYTCHMSGKGGEGYDVNSGSWFINSLCDALREDGASGVAEWCNFLQILTRANRKMLHKYNEFVKEKAKEEKSEENEKKTKGKTELTLSNCIPTVTSMLTKQVRLPVP